MANQDMMSEVPNTKRVFFKKELDIKKLGKQTYSVAEEIVAEHSVYVLRKFTSEDYEQTEQIDFLIKKIPNQFNQLFGSIMIQSIYKDTRQNCVYITLLLVMDKPLSKGQVKEIREWFDEVKVTEISVQRSDQDIEEDVEEDIYELMGGLNETNNQVGLLTQIINQLNENVSDIYKEIQVLKRRNEAQEITKMPNHTVEEEIQHVQKVEKLTAEVQQVRKELSTFKLSMEKERQQQLAKKTTPVVKLAKMESSATCSIEEQLKEVVKKIDLLEQKIGQSDQQVAISQKKLTDNEALKRPKVSFTKARQSSSTNEEIAEKLNETNEKVGTISEIMNLFNEKLTMAEKKISVFQAVEATVSEVDNQNAKLMTEFTTIKQEIPKITANYQEGQQQLSGKMDEVNQMLKTIQSLDKEYAKIRKYVDNFKEEYVGLSEGEKMNRQLVEHTKEIKQVMESTRSFDKKITTINKKITTLEAKINDSTEHDKAQQQLSATTQEMTQIAEKVQLLNDQLTKAREQINHLESEINTSSKKNNVNERLKENSQEIHKNTEIVNALGDELLRLRKRTVELEEKRLAPEKYKQTQLQLKENAQDIRRMTETIYGLSDELLKVRERMVELDKNRSGEKWIARATTNEKKICLDYQLIEESIGEQSIHLIAEFQSNGVYQPIEKFPLKEILPTVAPAALSAEVPPPKEQVGAIPSHQESSNELNGNERYSMQELGKEIYRYFNEDEPRVGLKGKIKKEDFYPMIRKIEFLPYLWANIRQEESMDILIDGRLSVGELLAELTQFLEEIKRTTHKKTMTNKWVHCSKELVQQLEGYKLLSDYLELYHTKQVKSL